MSTCTMSSLPSSFNETDAMFLEFIEDLNNPDGGSSSVGDNLGVSNALGVEKPISPYTVRFNQAIGICRKTFLVHSLRFIEHHMLSTFKEFKGDCHKHFKKYTNLRMHMPTHHTYWRNHGPTRLLNRSNLTIIATGRSRFYNDNTSSLSKEVSRSILWSCSSKHTFETGLLYCRPQKMRIIKCWKSSSSLSQMVLSHSLKTRYVMLCWVDDRATLKALARDPSLSPAKRLV
ncbi:NBS-LRR type resistance protein [Cucumis melo var. makuwa]|uniref:NBS-LRR type resistance protein n=1 Tax=Cucumis melo var. makuwa TaxID=1194695 RepID=A0A5D3DIR3_CUCMM|nr:NBS-LRR type resistance protein [Cucumis melo var. makuwa]